MVRGRRRQRKQRGGILTLLIPAAVLAAEATRRKKRVGKSPPRNGRPINEVSGRCPDERAWVRWQSWPFSSNTIKDTLLLEPNSFKLWYVDPMDADIVMSRENDAGDVDCNVEGFCPCWRWLSRLGKSRNANGRAAINAQRDSAPTRKKRKAVTFSMDWDNQYESYLCEWCRDHIQKHFHCELCGVCGSRFSINRPWSMPTLQQAHHGLAHGTSSVVFEKRVTYWVGQDVGVDVCGFAPHLAML